MSGRARRILAHDVERDRSDVGEKRALSTRLERVEPIERAHERHLHEIVRVREPARRVRQPAVRPLLELGQESCEQALARGVIAGASEREQDLSGLGTRRPGRRRRSGGGHHDAGIFRPAPEGVKEDMRVLCGERAPRPTATTPLQPR